MTPQPHPSLYIPCSLTRGVFCFSTNYVLGMDSWHKDSIHEPVQRRLNRVPNTTNMKKKKQTLGVFVCLFCFNIYRGGTDSQNQTDLWCTIQYNIICTLNHVHLAPAKSLLTPIPPPLPTSTYPTTLFPLAITTSLSGSMCYVYMFLG